MSSRFLERVAPFDLSLSTTGALSQRQIALKVHSGISLGTNQRLLANTRSFEGAAVGLVCKVCCLPDSLSGTSCDMSAGQGSLGREASASSSNSSSDSSLIDFLTLIQSLKTTKRTGWINHGVSGPESIADHMYRMSIMAFMTDPKDTTVNRDRCIRMAIVHDIAEAIVGDITPNDGVSKEEKSRREAAAIEHMCSLLGKTPQALEMRELWLEYEAATSPEALLVKDFDKLEMILQAQEYETAQGKQLNDFFDATAGRFQTDVGKKLALEIAARRPAPPRK